MNVMTDKEQAISPGGPLLMSVSDVAAMLDISEPSVWRLLSRGHMPEPVRIKDDWFIELARELTLVPELPQNN